ncbi:anthocyanidin 3-O-glucosyltransferase 2-like [Ziziphus jujuba]|uniref:Glycosyltransferase n=1 Tax=Ziziphus jujuba TaxID=326968 RepID=A0ABM3IHF5_ZIZJJ|nr:anthocyanidin 3-O-glucosyltransferase 2-like [Ziziphus jujuba]
MKKAELVFIPFPGWSHIVMTFEISKFLVKQDERLSITVVLTKSPFDSKVETFIDSLHSSSSKPDGINLILLPENNILSSEIEPSIIMGKFMEYQKLHVKEAVTKLMRSNGDSPGRIAGLVIDMLCSQIMDVADELGIPKYSFFPSCAGSLGVYLHLLTLYHELNVDLTKFKNDRVTELHMPCFTNPIPAGVLPDVVLDKAGAELILNHAKRIRETKGVIMNTFIELETQTIQTLSSDLPPLYPVGPILNMILSGDSLLKSKGAHKNSDIINWLDDQPPLSVVFLCFGSLGEFSKEQLKEIADALQNCGFRFIWSLRQAQKDDITGLTEFTYPKEVLPKEFFDRTAGIGKVIGWAPQLAILSHPSVGGFVTHCGWNSMLESLSFGVPVAAWPLYADHGPIAFQMVRELGLGAEIKLDYRLKCDYNIHDEDVIVTAKEIEEAIRKVMEAESEMRKRVKDMSEKCKKTLLLGGSSYFSIRRLINDVINNIP